MSPHYFLSVHLLLAIGYLLYKLMGNDTFFTGRRLFLLGITLFALTAEPLTPERAVVSWSAPTQLTQMTIGPLLAGNATNNPYAFDIGSAFWTVYGCIATLLLLRLFLRLYRIRQMVHLSVPRRQSNIDYRILKEEETGAFSFFRHIFISKDQESSPQLPYILLHEQAHVKGLHSLDIIWMQLVGAILWINPFVPLITRELRVVHEYLADRAVRSVTTDVKGYQLALLHQTPSSAAALLNNFNVSSLKRRISMLNKKTTSRKWSVKFLVLLPAALTAMVCSSWTKAPTLTSTPTTQSATQTEFHGSSQTQQSPADKLATYPGGETALMEDIVKNIRFPAKAIKDKVNGKCVISFIINTDGSISNSRVYKSLTPECDKEALRVVRQLKKFQPAMKDGKPVAMEYELPIKFRYK